MAITLVLHEATRTGAPRVGGLIARELAKGEKIHVIVLKDGPLVPWLIDCVGSANLTVIESDEFSHLVDFEQRLRSAIGLLEARDDDLIYVNSVAASVFVIAAKMLQRRALIHVHEKVAEIKSLLRCGLTKIDVMALADGAVLAAEDLARDIIETYGRLPRNCVNFGVAIEIEGVRAAAAATPTPARNASGEAFRKGERLVVGMCGQGSPRKGADIFLASAEAAPDCDFLWVGGWAPDEAEINDAYEAYVEKKLPNFYVAGAVENPYAHIALMDLFFLSSREDPNPLVLVEAMALRVPLLCFSRTTAVADRLGRSAILCHGLPNVGEAVRVINACAPEKIRSESFRSLSDSWVSAFDLKEKMGVITDLIEKIRAVEAAPASGASGR